MGSPRGERCEGGALAERTQSCVEEKLTKDKAARKTEGEHDMRLLYWSTR